MATASILRIGPSENNVCANILTKALVAQFETETTRDDNNNSGGGGGGGADNEAHLVLQNKYFRANVILKDIESDSTIGTTLLVPPTTTAKEDGVILVFDALLSNPDRPPTPAGERGVTFDALTATHQLAEHNGTCGDLLRLCVGVSLGEHSPEELRGGTSHEKEYSRRILWCLDHGYEYVEADLSQEGQQKGHEDRDKDGFARVVEAIQGTVWSSAVVGSTLKQELKETYATDKEAMKEEKEEEDPYQPPDPALFQPTTPDATDAKTEEKHDNDALEAAAASSLLDPAEVGAPEIAKLRDDLEADKLFDKMESVLKQANEIRSASKKGIMTDDERRERAGDAALALVNLMGQFGMEDEEDVSEGSDSEDSGVTDAVAS
ncbi:MAG: hypothetical protein SGILL_001425 [Bacillariaceae sp.]